MNLPTYWYYGCSEFFFMRCHVCPRCNTSLIKQKHQRIVNSKSDEAKKYNGFTMDGYGLHGDVRVITYTFKCPFCMCAYEPEVLERLEKQQRKERRKQKVNKLLCKLHREKDQN